MSLCLYDAKILGSTIKKARQKKHLTQAACAELLDFSLSFQKDIERGRFSPSLENFYHICRTLNISADACIFPDTDKSDPDYQELIRTISKCHRSQLRILLSTAAALLENDNTDNKVSKRMPVNKSKGKRNDLC